MTTKLSRLREIVAAKVTHADVLTIEAHEMKHNTLVWCLAEIDRLLNEQEIAPAICDVCGDSYITCDCENARLRK